MVTMMCDSRRPNRPSVAKQVKTASAPVSSSASRSGQSQPHSPSEPLLSQLQRRVLHFSTTKIRPLMAHWDMEEAKGEIDFSASLCDGAV